MHYNAFLAVLFLRVVLYGQQNLVWFKKFPCTDGSLCAKLETDWPRRRAPWATEIYLPPPLLCWI